MAVMKDGGFNEITYHWNIQPSYVLSKGVISNPLSGKINLEVIYFRHTRVTPMINNGSIGESLLHIESSSSYQFTQVLNPLLFRKMRFKLNRKTHRNRCENNTAYTCF